MTLPQIFRHLRSLVPFLVITTGVLPGCDTTATKNASEVGVADFAKPRKSGSSEATANPNNQIDAAHVAPRQDRLGGNDTQGDNHVPPQVQQATQHHPVNGATPPLDSTYTIDGMVGHVNGQPIYATEAFEPIQEQLAELGRSQPASEFRARAAQLIQGRLQQLIVDSLILGEAERDLSEQEQTGLLALLAQRREEFIRFWGKGSVALAEENIVRETGRSLDETITDTRERLLVQRYLRQRLWPKINVTRKNIERYYADHIDEYNPPPVRVIRLIRTKDPADARSIDDMLRIGAPFEEVASTKANRYRPAEGGLVSENAVGDSVFGNEDLNAALAKIGPGEHSRRIKVGNGYCWVYYESRQSEPARSLVEAQLEIEDLLRRREFQRLTQEYRRELIETGSYTSIEDMGTSLLDIAMTRYAMAQ